jgi:RNA polymerase sigma-70 factor (ECF subfamily)
MEFSGSTHAASAADPDRSEYIRAALERFEAPLVSYALGLTGELESARDAVQDTFLRLCEQPPGLVDGHLAPWLFTVCRNRIFDVRRKDRHMTALNEVELEHRAAPGPSPDESAATRDRSGRVEAILASLPPNQREVVRLKFQHQLSYQEIAAVTALSVTNVGFLLHTALKTLRGRLEQLERLPPSVRG